MAKANIFKLSCIDSVYLWRHWFSLLCAHPTISCWQRSGMWIIMRITERKKDQVNRLWRSWKLHKKTTVQRWFGICACQGRCKAIRIFFSLYRTYDFFRILPASHCDAPIFHWEPSIIDTWRQSIFVISVETNGSYPELGKYCRKWSNL